jgi:hypothetical protein
MNVLAAAGAASNDNYMYGWLPVHGCSTCSRCATVLLPSYRPICLAIRLSHSRCMMLDDALVIGCLLLGTYMTYM